jgi:hypothetical protein
VSNLYCAPLHSGVNQFEASGVISAYRHRCDVCDVEGHAQGRHLPEGWVSVAIEIGATFPHRRFSGDLCAGCKDLPAVVIATSAEALQQRRAAAMRRL